MNQASGQPEFEELLLLAQEVKRDLEARIGAQALEKPEWLAAVDARASCLQSLWNVLRHTELSLVYIARHLGEAGWWAALRAGLPSIRQITFEFTAYSQCSKFATFHLALSAVENSQRSFLRALAPTAANESRAEYKSVYDCLLRTHLAAPERDLVLLDLLRLIRNTIHNEGVHRPPSGKPIALVLDGVEYEFQDDVPIEFVTWRFVLDRVRDLVELQDRTVRRAPLWELAAHLPDASAEVLPRLPPNKHLQLPGA